MSQGVRLEPEEPPANLTAPFVLLEDRLSRQAPARLYRDPVAVVRCDDPAAVEAAFDAIEAGLGRGLHAAGFFAYELGYALEPALAARMPEARDGPLLWFGLFEGARALTAQALDEAFAALGPPPPIAALAAGRERADHMAKVDEVLRLIRAGDLYQANLTFPMRFRYAGAPLALYAALRARQPVAHGGVVAMGDRTLLSVSPELFVEVRGDRATARPMKGTAARESGAQADAAAARRLPADPKQRAENLMIVDLLRNDLSRISRPGSVRTPALFTVETFPTFHALTSTVTAGLRPGTSLRARMTALFPCGSIVGAPKIRAAEAIADLETEPRGAYTGAIGAIEPGGDMAFNVAIRTAVLSTTGEGSYGVGGGIVADSDPAGEYDEALLKARVLTDLAEDYGLIETFRWSAGSFIRLSAHLDRLGASALRLGFTFDRDAAGAELARLGEAWAGDDRRVRVVLSRDGALAVTCEAAAPPSDRVLQVGVAADRLDAGDPFLRHKTTHRAVYERAFAAAAARGLDEALLLNRDEAAADASRNSLFVEIAGRLVTPPLNAGALPGVLRRTLIADGQAIEAPLILDDIRRAERWFLGNSLHGLRRARLVEAG
ncbi:aminodeoxychorismate synthase component I [Phenylobacterium sp.]|uniref:aminodeoxychorismate synthase component I n=1 Tax=Phenylobacterium sp. TaxID=1871053 RepID=UPI0035617D2E